MRIYRKAAHRAMKHTAKAADTLRQPLSFVSREMVADVFDSQLRGRRDITACFTGHRSIPKAEQEAVLQRLDAVLERLYSRGYRDFISGGALGFDTLAAEAVLRMKVRCADARLILAIPCVTQSAKWSANDTQRYERLLYAADELKVLSQFYYDGCMLVRNRYMVDQSSFCIAYLTHMRGGTMSTVSYAMQQECPVLNVAMADACGRFCQE